MHVFDRYDEYEPYERPEAHVGFIMDGQPVDDYGQGLETYGGHPNGNTDDDYHSAGRYGYGGR